MPYKFGFIYMQTLVYNILGLLLGSFLINFVPVIFFQRYEIYGFLYSFA